MHKKIVFNGDPQWVVLTLFQITVFFKPWKSVFLYMFTEMNSLSSKSGFATSFGDFGFL